MLWLSSPLRLADTRSPKPRDCVRVGYGVDVQHDILANKGNTLCDPMAAIRRKPPKLHQWPAIGRETEKIPRPMETIGMPASMMMSTISTLQRYDAGSG
jgi:hypothetical protein